MLNWGTTVNDVRKKEPLVKPTKKSTLISWLSEKVPSPYGAGEFKTWADVGFVPPGKKATDPADYPIGSGRGERKTYYEPRGAFLAKTAGSTVVIAQLVKQAKSVFDFQRMLSQYKKTIATTRVLQPSLKIPEQAGIGIAERLKGLQRAGRMKEFYALKAKAVGIPAGVEFYAGLPVPKQNLINQIIKVNPSLDMKVLADMSVPALTKMATQVGVPTKAPEVKPPTVAEIAKPPEAPLATQAQKAQAHILAKEKAMLTPEGKPKPQYRRLAQGMTGKKSVKDMTEVEAGEFINALKTISEPYFKAGKLIPPTIPITKRIATEDFFKQKYKTPTPIKHLTSQTYYAEKLGVKPLVEPLELAKQNLDLETRALEGAINQQEKIIDKVGGTTLFQRAEAKLTNTPTPAVQEMRKLLDTYEEAPTFLSLEKKKTFDWFRNLNRTILEGENKVRAELGLDQIKYRKAYVRHIADKTAQELLQGKYPFPEGLKYWADRIVGKTIHNPMVMQRQLADDLENFFTKDLIYATNAMVRTGLKEIHLSQPLRAFSEQLGALSKDIPQYKTLTPEQLNAVREMSVMPASTKRWLIEYVNQVIKGQQTHLDEAVNKMVTDSGVGVMLNKVLKPFGRSLSKRPVTNTFKTIGRGIIHGVMGWIPRQLVRNKFQLFQNLSLYTIKANLKGALPVSVDKNLQELINKSVFYKSYTGVEETPRDIKNALERAWMAPYQWTAVTNAGQSMKVAYWDTLDLITKPKYKNLGWADPQRTYKEPKDFLYLSEKDKLLKEMEFGAGVTQFSYIPMGMPQIFRYKALTPITRLQSWWMNYFTRFTRESIHRLFKGETSYGAKLPWSRRLGYGRYLLIAGAIFSALGYKRSFLLGVLPTYLSPAAQLALGMYLYIASDKEWEKQRALKQMQYSWKAFIPGSGAWRNWSDVWTGKKPLEALFFYTKPPKGTVGEFTLKGKKKRSSNLAW